MNSGNQFSIPAKRKNKADEIDMIQPVCVQAKIF